MADFKKKTDDELNEMYKFAKGSGSPAERLIEEELASRGVTPQAPVKPTVPDIIGKKPSETTDTELNYFEKTSGSPSAEIERRKRTENEDNNSRPVFNYQESDAVKNSREAVGAHNNTRPATWDSAAESTGLVKAYDKIMNRADFKYNVNADALYQQYKQKYIDNGRLAMEDTMGKASAMTGGYGNSYAAMVGNQAYQSYMNELNDVIPQLYQLALDKYNREGDELYDQYDLERQKYTDRYGEYRDKVSDWNAEDERLRDIYETELKTDYNRYADKYDKSVKEYNDKLSEQKAAETGTVKTTTPNYKLADYNTVEEKAAEYAGDPDALYNYLKSVVGVFISQDMMDALYEKYRNGKTTKVDTELSNKLPTKNTADVLRSQGFIYHK